VNWHWAWLPPHYATVVDDWLAGRRWSVPATMVERATGRRLAGDWRGAGEAAGFHVRVDLDAVRHRYGAEVADRVGDDLRHLVPDLVRWHLPRELTGGHGRILPDLAVGLAWYGTDAPDAPALWVQTQTHREGPQQPHLRFGPLDRADPAVQGERWDGARYLWDSRATDGLRHRLNAWPAGDDVNPVTDRTPYFHRDGRSSWSDRPYPPHLRLPAEDIMVELFHGNVDKAWATAGVTADMNPENRDNWWFEVHLNEQRHAMVASLVAEVRGRLASGSQAEVFVPGHLPDYYRTVLVRATSDGLTATVARDRRDLSGVEILPRVTWQSFPELELLHLDLLPAHGLHPLVRAALFPDETDPDGYRPREDVTAPETVRVRCGGGWHRVGWRGGRIDAHDHPPEEARRERVLRTLGGAVPPCLTVVETWRTPTGERMPAALRRLRRDASALIRGGDVTAFLDLLDRGIDSAGIRDRRRRTPLHLAAHLAGPDVDAGALVRRLVDAGLDVDARDALDRTPLAIVLFDGGSAPLVRALLDAGADPMHRDRLGLSALHVMRSLDAATILPWLLDAGLPLNGTDRYRTPLVYQAAVRAPVETLRAMLDAGAEGDIRWAIDRRRNDALPVSAHLLADYRTVRPTGERQHG
jgi:hypothetical protein